MKTNPLHDKIDINFSHKLDNYSNSQVMNIVQIQWQN